MRFAEFELDRVIFEAKYKRAFRLWDSAGAVALALMEAFPNSENVEANPSKIAFVSKDRNSDFAVELERVGLTFIKGSSTMEDAGDMAQKVIQIAFKNLQITELERVGARAIFTKKEKSLTDATKKVEEMGLVRIPEGSHFGTDKPPTSLDLRFRWEDGPRGVNLNVRSELLRIEFTPPREIDDVEATIEERPRIVLDVDYFTPKPITAAQLSPRDWITSLRGITNRDVPRFLGFL